MEPKEVAAKDVPNTTDDTKKLPTDCLYDSIFTLETKRKMSFSQFIHLLFSFRQRCHVSFINIIEPMIYILYILKYINL